MHHCCRVTCFAIPIPSAILANSFLPSPLYVLVYSKTRFVDKPESFADYDTASIYFPYVLSENEDQRVIQSSRNRKTGITTDRYLVGRLVMMNSAWFYLCSAFPPLSGCCCCIITGVYESFCFIQCSVNLSKFSRMCSSIATTQLLCISPISMSQNILCNVAQY